MSVRTNGDWMCEDLLPQKWGYSSDAQPAARRYETARDTQTNGLSIVLCIQI
jgi:hypothetical protein